MMSLLSVIAAAPPSILPRTFLGDLIPLPPSLSDTYIGRGMHLVGIGIGIGEAGFSQRDNWGQGGCVGMRVRFIVPHWHRLIPFVFPNAATHAAEVLHRPAHGAHGGVRPPDGLDGGRGAGGAAAAGRRQSARGSAAAEKKIRVFLDFRHFSDFSSF